MKLVLPYMNKVFIIPAVALIGVLLAGCMKWDYGLQESFNETGEGLFITNEGNFQYGNASLSFYNPTTRKVENEVF